MNSAPDNNPKFDIQSVVDGMKWGTAFEREIDGRNVTVKTAAATELFWTAWGSAKAEVKEAGLSASKNAEGTWISAIHAQIDAELEEVRKLRHGLANLARFGKDLTPEDSAKAINLKKLVYARIANPANKENRGTYEFEMRIIKAFLLE